MSSLSVLARVMSRRVRALAEHLPPALEADVTSVHHARVASRRLREFVPIVSGVRPRRRHRQLLRRLQKLTRALGVVRELDVSLAAIDRLAAAHETPRVALAALRTPLARERELQGARLEQRFDHGRIGRLLARLARLESSLGETESSGPWRELLADRIRRRARGLQAAVAAAGALFDSERLHEVRIAGKKLRYALEVAGEARCAATGALVRQLKDTQDVLGRLHDVEVLLAHARPLASASENDAAGSAALVAGVDWLDRELTAETRRLHARYLRRQAALIATADRALDVIAPRVASQVRQVASIDHA